MTKRIKGLSLTLEDFFNTDSFYIHYLINKEMELIEKENEEYERMEMEMNNTNSTGSKTPLKEKDSEDAIMAYEAYFEE